jgi:2-phospho-L-lactate guanylyltransferase (CobY/MobA/RfbA family)
MGRGNPSVVIATDQNRDGTNALFMRPPGIIPYAYGPGSYQRHTDLARAAGVKAKTFFSEQLSLDIDVAGDLETYNQLAKQANQPQLFVSD